MAKGSTEQCVKLEVQIAPWFRDLADATAQGINLVRMTVGLEPIELTDAALETMVAAAFGLSQDKLDKGLYWQTPTYTSEGDYEFEVRTVPVQDGDGDPEIHAALARQTLTLYVRKEGGVHLKQVTFSGAKCHTITADDGNVNYDREHWLDSNLDGDALDSGDHQYPVCFTKGSKMAAAVTIAAGPQEAFPGSSFKIRGYALSPQDEFRPKSCTTGGTRPIQGRPRRSAC